MKSCPKCGQAFNDDSLRFCLIDGTSLTDERSEPTVAIPAARPTNALPNSANKARKSLWLWIALAAIVLIIGFVAIAGLVYFSYRLGSQSARVTRQSATNASPQPMATAKTPTGITTAPSVAETPEDNSDTTTDASDEVTPISWSTSVVSFKQETGTTYKFLCPPAGTAGTVWGSDVYTTDSSICTAAVHAGKITLEQGGEVTIEIRPGKSIYGSTTRNGVTSNPYGEFAHSFVFK